MRKGSHHTEESRRKISEARKRDWSDPEYRHTQSEAHKGKRAWNKGIACSDAVKQKIGAANKGRVRNEEARRNMSRAQRQRKPFSEEHRRKIGEANKRRVIGEETRRKISEAKQGRRLSEEHRQKIAEGGRGKQLSAICKHRISEALKGRPKSEEHRRKLSVAQKASWAKGDFNDVDFHPPSVTYAGVQMRSTWEARLAAAFDALGWEWEYESHKFQYELADGPHTYTPDFYVPELDCHFDPHWSFKDDWAKFNAVREQLGIRLIVLGEQLLKAYEHAAGVGRA